MGVQGRRVGWLMNLAMTELRGLLELVDQLKRREPCWDEDFETKLWHNYNNICMRLEANATSCTEDDAVTVEA